MTLVHCQVADELANPLFEVFDGGDFVLSSYRDVEATSTTMQIFFPDETSAPRAIECLKAAGRIVGADLAPQVCTFPDEDWKYAYRKYFKTDIISPRLAVVPVWETYAPTPGQKALKLDPGMAFGTGQHATTRACLEFIDREAAADPARTFLDVGCGSGILSIASKLLGFKDVRAFELDPDAVQAAT
ncbi:MAG: 50S ribosomal protein L11 methyltransferase [Kiritimatiellae bacterium]|nr:50S ribosomal protein L11 methyltransferase [Kiritimatiellia bacterium]